MDSRSDARSRRSVKRLAFAALCISLTASSALAQNTSTVGGKSEVFVDSDLERYLRYLQTEGEVGLYPWSIRGFSPREIDRISPSDSAHPWADRYDLGHRGGSGGAEFDVVRPTATVRFNSAFPYGSNDGPIWAGRGLTTSLQTGFSARWRWISLKVAPTAFRAENRPFHLMPNQQTGDRRFSDGINPNGLDRPQRFGDAPYAVLDPGESFLRFDSRLLALGVSTADQGWGPADVYPYILGNNAAGFPHVFLGTGSPWNLWIARIHARVVYGKLAQSNYSSMRPDSVETRRFMSGAIALFQPRGLPGLEIGAARFFHSSWPENGVRWNDLRIPFEQVSKKSLIDATSQNDDARNQLASLFFRWVLPHSGFEVYGEFGKEDHNWDVRDLTLELDHASTHMFGFRKAWSTPRRMIALRGEVIDLRVKSVDEFRTSQSIYYVHAQLQHGHTNRGQLLGADVPAGSGAGSTLALEGYSTRGRGTLEWKRTLADPFGDYRVTTIRPPRTPEAQHSLGADVLLFRGPLDLHAGVTAIYDINRYFAQDGFNLNAVLGSRWAW